MLKNNLPQILVTNPDGKVFLSLKYPDDLLDSTSATSSLANQQEMAGHTEKRLVAKNSSFLSTGTVL